MLELRARRDFGDAQRGVGEEPDFSRGMADTREHGACLSSLLDEIATLVELPAVVPDIVRDLADMVGPGSCLSPFGKRDLGVARRCTVESARLDWLHKCFVWSSVRLIGSVGLTRSE